MKGLLVVSVAAMLCGYVLAAEQSTQRDRDQDKATQQTQQTQQQHSNRGSRPCSTGAGAQQSGMLHKTSKLIGKEVKNTQNENLGSIHDLVLTADHQQVSYAALSSGGTLGMGAKYYAVPWSAIQVGPQGDITMSISKSQLDQASAFDKNNWPAQPDWQLTSSMPGPDVRTAIAEPSKPRIRARIETLSHRSGPGPDRTQTPRSRLRVQIGRLTSRPLRQAPSGRERRTPTGTGR